MHLKGVGSLLHRWRQPESLVLAGLAHSVYSTEEFPLAVFSWRESAMLEDLVGGVAEHRAFLYCTASQSGLYRSVRDLARRGGSLADGLVVRNCHSRASARWSAEIAAEVLLILAADLMEQEPFFHLYVPYHCLRLAGPFLAKAPPALPFLERSGFFQLSAAEVLRAERACRASVKAVAAVLSIPIEERMLRRKEIVASYSEAAQAALSNPFVPELALRVAMMDRALPKSLSFPLREEARRNWAEDGAEAACRDLGTLWSAIAPPAEVDTLCRAAASS